MSLRRLAIRLLPRPVRSRVAPWLRLRRMLHRLRRERRPVAARPHGLPGELIVSVTSFPPRFATLHLTLESLLNQTVAPDRVILWLADADLARLPRRVRALRGLDIRGGPDLRSYKKLVPALAAFPDAFVATADDDAFYRPDWLADLVADPAPGVVTCHRAHRLPAHGGTPPPYRDWDWDARDDAARTPSIDLVPTGVGGVLYPPGALHADATDRAAFAALAPTADDLWFYWMGRRAGSACRKVGPRFDQLIWPGSQVESLYRVNVDVNVIGDDANDRQARALWDRYGDPAAMPRRAGR